MCYATLYFVKDVRVVQFGDLRAAWMHNIGPSLLETVIICINEKGYQFIQFALYIMYLYNVCI